VAIALEVAQQWQHPILEQNTGSYLLGSASPDIRIITRQPRLETHFAPLNSDSVDAGVAVMLERYPRLARSQELSEATRAFVAGYISHLVSDQLWIMDIYHSFFGNQEVFEDRVLGNIMDRALQMEMERQDRSIWEEVVPLLEGAEDGIDMDFIPPEVLKEWREWVQAVPEREFTWERLRFMARRQYPEGNERAQEAVEEFLESVSEGLERIYERVPRERVRQYRERCVAEFTRVTTEYLR
jgi:hypothetical protein